MRETSGRGMLPAIRESCRNHLDRANNSQVNSSDYEIQAELNMNKNMYILFIHRF